MALAIFDLDNTLLGGDSDYLWGQFLVEQGIVDAAEYERENTRFYKEYEEGTLDIMAFLAFSLRPLSQHPRSQLDAWHRQFMAAKIEPIVLPAAERLVAGHRERGDALLIITATNRFITAPIARRFGIDHLLATDPELVDDRYTGRVAGMPCFQGGKVERLHQWLQSSGQSLEGSSFYSDSANDLPLLQSVSHPVAVDPDARLRAHADAAGWPIMTLRNG